MVQLTVNGTLILTTDDNGNMGSIQDTGLVTGNGSIEVIYESSISKLVGETCSGYLDYNAYIYDAIITHTLNLSVGMKF
ncbi:MAG: hypothetical protein R3Y46_05705 [Opitutales bacterium]